ncbi:MAG: beta-lactamase family protein [Candidatus Sumerlaeia bacterium]|nr:beta-lactamase family protein [Candidatus Sumerlaeia bacterium]
MVRCLVGMLVMVLGMTGCGAGAARSELRMEPKARKLIAMHVDRMVAEAYPDADAPGCAVLVRVDGETIFARGYGRAHLETGEPITPETHFRLASVSKQFTASATLRLVEQGRLRLDESLTDIFPDFPAYGRAITVRHLLDHTSGLRAYEGLMPRGTTVPILDAGVLELLAAQDSGMFLPGEQYSYSNSGYAVLAMIVEARSGKRFADFLHDEFFAPLGMDGTVAFENGRSEVPRRAYGYRRNDDGTWRFADQSMTSSVLGDGGIYCSATNYARWADAHFAGRVLREDLHRQAWTRSATNDGTPIGYGFGWYLEEVDGISRVFHTGSTTGFNNSARLVPSHRLCVVFLSNRTGTEPAALAADIERLVLETLARTGAKP